MIYQPATIWRFDASEPKAAMHARLGFTEYLEQHCTAGSDIVGAEIVFAELVSNAFRHGGGSVQIWVECSEAGCTLNVHDGGKGFEIGTPRLPEDALSEGGRGLYLVWALSKRLEVIPVDHDGSIVKAVLPVSVAA